MIRPATLHDAEAMDALRSASIRALCSPDHHDDPLAIERWIGPSGKFAHLLEQHQTTLVVAEIDACIVGLGGLRGDTITLNYVHPDHRFQGISKALMVALESLLRRDGVTIGRLHSSVTALDFYRSQGWVEAGVATPEDGQPMVKPL